MKLFLLLFACCIYSVSRAQITNTREGLWNDNTVWSNNIIPSENDDVVLYFDMTVNGSAYCRSLSTNGHNVTVNPGGNLFITGTGGYRDTLLSRFLVIDTTTAVPDTVETWDFFYDSLKRLVSNVKKEFESGLTRKSVSAFSYEGNNRWPSTVYGYSYYYINNDSFFYEGMSYLRFQNDRLVFDSSQDYFTSYTYLPNAVTMQSVDIITNFISYDTLYVQYDANGNITRQVNYATQDSFNYIYDSHPNPFYVYNHIARPPVYLLETFLQEVIAKNNALLVDQYTAGNPGYQSGLIYRYNAYGYPVEVWGYDPAFPLEIGGKGVYLYTH